MADSGSSNDDLTQAELNLLRQQAEGGHNVHPELVRKLLADRDRWVQRAHEAQERSIGARNPGIDMDRKPGDPVECGMCSGGPVVNPDCPIHAGRKGPE